MLCIFLPYDLIQSYYRDNNLHNRQSLQIRCLHYCDPKHVQKKRKKSVKSLQIDKTKIEITRGYMGEEVDECIDGYRYRSYHRV